jgi:hypothetical protein
MLALTLVLLSVSGGIGSPRGVRLLDDAPMLLAEIAPPLLPYVAPPTDAQVSAQQLQVDIEALRKQRPPLGGGIALVTAGGSTALLGALYLAISGVAGVGIAGVNPFIIIGAVGLGIGLPLVAIGVWLLYNRLEERKHIDEETAKLREQLRSRQPTPQPYSPPYSPPQIAPPPPSDFPPPQVLSPGPEATMLMARF